mmetsp:Transcript_85931/g.270871  ORF Transcript_85931/g.270871 Transcript_85931/m.270871 type:complete len:233 (-) Transcript_85931:521-1219(-)
MHARCRNHSQQVAQRLRWWPGRRGLTMVWITPLEHWMSIFSMGTSFTRGPCFGHVVKVTTRVEPSRALKTRPAYMASNTARSKQMWERRRASKSGRANNCSSSCPNVLRKAASVGRNAVNGPPPASVCTTDSTALASLAKVRRSGSRAHVSMMGWWIGTDGGSTSMKASCMPRRPRGIQDCKTRKFKSPTTDTTTELSGFTMMSVIIANCPWVPGRASELSALCTRPTEPPM